MKKFFSLGLLSLILMAVSCSFEAAKPGDAYKEYMEKLANRDFRGFVDGILASEGKSDAEIEIARSQTAGIIGEVMGRTLKDKRGIQDVQIVEENLLNDSTANLKVTIFFGDGDHEDESVNMVRKDGKWYMSAN